MDEFLSFEKDLQNDHAEVEEKIERELENPSDYGDDEDEVVHRRAPKRSRRLVENMLYARKWKSKS
jgi:hypothetical protein